MPAAQAFIGLTEQVLARKPDSNLITLVEALKMIDVLTAKSKRELKTFGALSRSGYEHVGHTRFYFSADNHTLPRLTVLKTLNGYFLEAE